MYPGKKYSMIVVPKNENLGIHLTCSIQTTLYHLDYRKVKNDV